ncbi:MAG TPA: hypothetical protein VGG26_09000 [Terracidiphilus sp.]|jgi:DNA-binding phage protein
MSYYEESVEQFRLAYLVNAVMATGGNMGRAAQATGVHRNTISRVLRAGGYPASRIKRILKQRSAAHEALPAAKPPVSTHHAPAEADRRIA